MKQVVQAIKSGKMEVRELPDPIAGAGQVSKLAGEAYCIAYSRSFGIPAGLPLEIYGDGKQTRDFIFIDDLSDAAGEVFQIATHKETTVREIAMELKRLFKKGTGVDVDVVHGAPLIGDVRRNYSDISNAREVLGFEPRYDLSKGLQRTLDYFLQQR